MRIYSENAILKAKTYADIFSSDKGEAKRQFRYYCKSYHPDADDSPKAQEIFARLMDLYNRKPFSTDAGTTSFSRVFRSAETGKGFEIGNYVTVDAGTCTVYHTQRKVVMSFAKDYRKFYDAYLSNLKSVRYEDVAMEKQFSILFPKVLRNFEDTDGNYIILIEKTEEVLNLSLIVDAYQKSGTRFPEKHAAWIINRLYNLATYMDFYGKVYNGFALPDLWVSPEFHTVLPYGGWEYMTAAGGKMLGCPKDVYKVLPIGARDRHVSEIQTDLESIKLIGRKLFEGNQCKNILKFLDRGSVKNSVLDEWKSYEDAVMGDFGVRKFVAWENVPYAK